MDIEQWLKQNTFQCALGRVSPEQCEALRERPRFSETLGMRRMVPVMPRECENCTEWQEKIASFKSQKKKALGICKVDGCNEPAKVKGMCKRHYAQYYYHKNKEIGRKIREMNEKRKLSVCQDCGKEFVPYVRGAITIKALCPRCMNEHMAKGQQQAVNKAAQVTKITLAFDKALCEELRLRERLTKAAAKYFRTPELQALAYIVEGLEADGIGLDKNEGR